MYLSRRVPREQVPHAPAGAAPRADRALSSGHRGDLGPDRPESGPLALAIPDTFPPVAAGPQGRTRGCGPARGGTGAFRMRRAQDSRRVTRCCGQGPSRMTSPSRCDILSYAAGGRSASGGHRGLHLPGNCSPDRAAGGMDRAPGHPNAAAGGRSLAHPFVTAGSEMAKIIKPIIIVGTGCCGSTLFHRLLASH
jgi:hypothetical protein